MNNAGLDEIASTQHGLATLAQLLSLGTRDELRVLRAQKSLIRIRPGIYRLTGSPQTWHQQLMAVQLDADQAVVSHRAALYLHGLQDEPGAPEVTLPRALSRRMMGVIVHSSTAIARTVFVDGLRVTNVARTLIDVAHLLPAWQVTSLVEDALAARTTNFPAFRRELALIGGHGRRGVGVIRKLLDIYAPGDDRAGSGLARAVLRELRHLGMPEPETEWKVIAEGKPRHLDFAYPEAKIGVEAHSVAWHQRLTSFERDWDRDGALKSEGWTIYYVTNKNMTKALLRVKNALPATFLVQKGA